MIAGGLFIFANNAQAAADACNNPYMSLKQGDEIHYQSDDTNRSFQILVGDSEKGKTTINYQFPNSSLTQNISCQDKTVLAGNFVDTSAKDLALTAQEVTGSFLPGDVQLGSSWSTNYKASQNIDNKEVLYTIQIDHCAIAESRIKVPAGTYDTLKIRLTGTISSDNPDAPTQTIRQDLYFAKGIGLIKIVDKSNNQNIETVATYINVGDWKETAANIAAPTAVGLAAANTAIATQGILSVDLGRYLWFFITEPLLFFRRRKRRAWGTVYNALTRIPEDLVIVRVKNKSGKSVYTQVTDKEGRYSFLVPEGEYKLEAKKTGFSFPTNLAKTKKQDAQFLDIYHGETIKVGKNGKVITSNIPIDPVKKDDKDNEIIKKDYWHTTQEWTALAGPVVGIVAFILNPSLMIGIALVIGLFIYLFFRRFAMSLTPKQWGTVRDDIAKIPGSVVRVFIMPYNKLAEYVVTDSKGRFHLRVGQCEYYLTATKAGYKPLKTKNFNISKAKEPKVITESLKLEKV